MKSVNSLLRMLTAFALLLTLQNVYTDDTTMTREQKKQERQEARRAKFQSKRDAKNARKSNSATEEHVMSTEEVKHHEHEAMAHEATGHEEHAMMPEESSKDEAVAEESAAVME